jgi:hypothetical protein
MKRILLLTLLVFINLLFSQQLIPSQVAPSTTFELPKKPEPPKGEELLHQILLAIVTVGGCTAAGFVLAILDKKYENKNDIEKLKTIRTFEYIFLGSIAIVGVCILVYVGFELLRSAGIL